MKRLDIYSKRMSMVMWLCEIFLYIILHSSFFCVCVPFRPTLPTSLLEVEF